MSDAYRPATLGAALCLCLVACSSLPQSGDEVVALQVTTPASLLLSLGDSLQLHAVALNINGDTVPDLVRWRTVDTENISLDSATGLVVARSDTGSARVQASVGDLLSNLITITLQGDTTTNATLRAP